MHKRAGGIDNFEERGFADNVDRLFRIGDAGEFDNDLVVAAGLDKRLTDAELVDAALDRVPGPGERLRGNVPAVRWIGFEKNLKAALKIEALMDVDLVL